MPVRLFVGNLPYNATQAELKEHFSAVGPISYLSLPVLRETGQPRGFAFIEFNDRAQAEDAIRQFNNHLFKGRTIAVSEARPREDRPPGGVSTRPAEPRVSMNAEPDVVNRPAPLSKRGRDFGPDASPFAHRKGKGGSRPERGQKGPMREVVRGQFFGEDEDADDLYEDDDELNDDESSDEDDEIGEGDVETKDK